MANNNSIPDNLSNEQIISLLQMLFTNMNNLDKLYYDMFINTTPLTLTLERYNEEGVLESYELPNRAKDRTGLLQGRGNPERAQIAGIGTFYLDILTSNIWVKTIDEGATGWVMLYTPSNFIQGREYMSPTGDASGLQGLSASNIQGGIVAVANGGTGTTGLDGIIMGRGPELAYTTAVARVDYAIPDTFIGMLGLFMTSDLPEGWIPAYGQAVARRDYQKLADKLMPEGGTATYPNNLLQSDGEGGLSYTDEYGVVRHIGVGEMVIPNLQDRYIRGWKSTSGEVLGGFQKCALPNITGSFFNTQERETSIPKDPEGAFWRITSAGNGVDGTMGWFERLGFDASRSNPIYQADVNEVRTNNINALVAIFAGIDE